MKHLTLWFALFANLGSFLFGFDSGIVTTTIAHQTFLDYMHTTSDSELIGALTSTYAAGEAVGAIIAMWCVDAWGRKISIETASAVAAIGAAIQTGSVSMGMLLAGRIITGIAIGILLMVCPLYNAEISTTRTRGLIVGLSAQMIGIGFMIANWVGYGCSYASGQFQWRFPLAIQIPFGVILFFGMFWLPESPRWLAFKNRQDEAFEVLKLLHDQETEEFVQMEFVTMKEQIEYEKKVEVKTYKELFTKYRKRVSIGIAVQALTQLTGVNVVNYYQTTLYSGVGIKGHTVLLVASFYGMVGPAMNVYTITQVDKWGRVRTLWLDALGLACCLAIVMGTTAGYNQTGSKTMSGVSIAFIFIFSIVYSLGFNAISWIYTTEIFPVNIRAKGTAISTFANFVTNIVFNQISPTAFGHIGYKYYAVFICINVMTAVIIYLFFPETKQKSLEEIAEIFGDAVIVKEFDEVKKEAHAHEDEKSDIEQIAIENSQTHDQ